MKKVLAMLLCAVLLIAALPGNALAVTQDLSEQDAVKQEVRRIYTKCLTSAGKTSFAGFCGLMTSHQLWHLGINENLGATVDGNKQFDMYANAGVTSGGYHITAYPSPEFTLDQALATITRNGTKDAENILVGFQATNTEAGSVYGHALVIHTILDGIVYYVENFPTSLAGAEGNVIAVTIEDFVKFYSDWTVLDGVIHFGNLQYSDSCQSFGTDLFVRTRFESTLRSEPCLLTENECVRLRSLMAGELLHATAVYKNTRGELYYRISDGVCTGYVAANAVSVVQLNNEALTLEDISIPEAMVQGDKASVSGKILAQSSGIGSMRLAVTDQKKRVVLEGQLDVVGCSCELEQMSEQLDFSQLETGEYTVSVYATAECVCVRGTGLVTQYSEQLLHTQSLAVGDGAQSRRAAPKQEEKPADGWFLKDGVWHCYRNQKPCTGWVTYLGVDYYLNKDGSVTTGWAEIDGWQRYFSATGAMCSGWVTTDKGIHYWLPDGTEAYGWQEIDGKLYCFDEAGLLITEGTLENGGITYKIQPDGSATPEE